MLCQCAERQRAHRAAQQDRKPCSPCPVVQIWARFHDQPTIPGLHEGSCLISVQFLVAGSTTHTKYSSVTQLTLTGAFLGSSKERPRLELHGNRTPQNRGTRLQCCGDLHGTSEIEEVSNFCSLQLSPTFKFTYIKRKLNCPPPQKENHNKANILQQSICLNLLKLAKSTFQSQLPTPACQQQKCPFFPPLFYINKSQLWPWIASHASNISHSFTAVFCKGKEKTSSVTDNASIGHKQNFKNSIHKVRMVNYQNRIPSDEREQHKRSIPENKPKCIQSMSIWTKSW